MTFPFPHFCVSNIAAWGWYALARKNADDQNAISSGDITFDVDVSDDGNIHSILSNTAKFVVPAAWNGRYGIFRANVLTNSTASASLEAKKNGVGYQGAGRLDSDTGGTQAINIKSAPVVMATGDEFSAFVVLNSTDGIGAAEDTWAQLQVLPVTFSGALVAKSAGQAISASTLTAMAWGVETYDLNNYHSNVTNNTRLTTQSGESLVIVSSGIRSSSVTDAMSVRIYKNGATFPGSPIADHASGGEDHVCVESAPVAVTGGTDYFESMVAHNTATTIAQHEYSWFSIRVLPSSTKYALVNLTSNETIVADVPEIIAWDAETADTDGFWNSGAPTVLKIPSGLGGKYWQAGFNGLTSSSSGQFIAELLLDGVPFHGMAKSDTDTGGTDSLNMISGIIGPLAVGQELSIRCTGTGATKTLNSGDHTWFYIMEVEPVLS